MKKLQKKLNQQALDEEDLQEEAPETDETEE